MQIRPKHFSRLSCLSILVTLLMSCGGGSSSSPTPPPNNDGSAQAPDPTPDFDEVDSAFQTFIDESEVFDGISYVIVDAQETLHTA
ncbi:hypothetical protein N9L28_07235, partial [Luminiphilus sp.]|nr:hypothetical protein [Luminiphilus sp.]